MKKKKEPNQEDKKTWEDYIQDPTGIYDKDQNTSIIKQRRERYSYDLHGLTLDEANRKVTEIIHYCVKNNYSFSTSYHTKFPEFLSSLYLRHLYSFSSSFIFSVMAHAGFFLPLPLGLDF